MTRIVPAVFGGLAAFLIMTATGFAGETPAYLSYESFLLDTQSCPAQNLAPLGENPELYIGERRGGGLEIKATGAMQRRLVSMGCVLRPVPDWSHAPNTVKADTFTSYDNMILQLATLAAQYPALATAQELGYSWNARKIAGLRIAGTGSPARGRVEFRVVGNHHGDEYMAAEIPRLFAQYILEHYGTDDRVTHLLDNASILVVPMVNPDGHESNTRENARGVDINRNYSFHWKRWPGSGSEPLSEPEVRAIAWDHFNHAYSLSFSFHTYGDIVNYVWNYTELASPDEAMIIDLSDQYAAYNRYQVINGFDWYQTTGDTNDFSYGTTGDFDWTIEVADDGMQTVFDNNYDGIVTLFTRVIDEGLHVRVRDAVTGASLPAFVRIQSENGQSPASWSGYASELDGSFHRLISGGAKTLEVWAPGYDPYSQSISCTVSQLAEGVERTVDLQPRSENRTHRAAWQIIEVRSNDNNPDFPPDALGPADGRSYALGDKGVIMVRMAAACKTGAGPDLLIVADSAETHTATITVATDIFAEQRDAGQVQGSSTYLNLPQTIDEFSAVRLTDDGDADNRPREGFMLDAVICLYGAEIAPDGDIDEDANPDTDMTEEIDSEADMELLEIDDDETADAEETVTEPDGDAEARAEGADDADKSSETLENIEVETMDDDTISDGIETDGPGEITQVKGSGCAAGTGMAFMTLLAFLAVLRRSRRTYPEESIDE